MAGKPRGDEGKTNIPPTFGPWVQRLVDQREWTKRRAAREMGMAVDTYNRILAGGLVRLELGHMEAIAEALNMDLGFVLHKAGVDINADGVNLDRVQRVESIAAAYEQIETITRSALSESAALLSSAMRRAERNGQTDPDELLPVPEPRAVLRQVTDALLVLDQAASRLRAEGYITYTSGAVQGRESNERRGTVWTADEDRMLSSDLDENELSRRLGRPVAGIRHRRMRLKEDAAKEAARNQQREEARAQEASQ